MASRVVLAIFGPTGSGKSAVAEALARADPGRDRLRRLDAALPRPADPHEPVARAARRHLAARPRGLGRRVPAARARRDRRDPRRRQDAGRRRRHRPLPPSCALRPLRCHRLRSPASGSAGSGSTTTEGAESAHAKLAELDPEAAAAVHPNDRRRVVRSLELAGRATAIGDRLWADDTRHPTLVFGLDVPKEELDRRIDARDAGDVRGRRREPRRRRRSPPESRRRPRYAHGLADIAEHADDEAAIEALVARTKRYAAYQRKWMRRIPGLVSLPANRPPGEVADEILEVARARQRLPAGRAG